ncbi:hypothetical protein [Streptococcus porci]|nr:hypothetical protein [Streptococcus porci]
MCGDKRGVTSINSLDLSGLVRNGGDDAGTLSANRICDSLGGIDGKIT